MNKKIWKLFQNILRKLFNIESVEEQAADLISEIENQAESVEPFSYGLVSSTETQEKEMGFRLNVSEGQANYSQRKSKYRHVQRGQYGENVLDWQSLCNCHSLAMAFLYSGWGFSASDYEREPDALADFIIKECLKDENWFKTKMYNYWYNWYEGSPKACTPVEYHDVLAHYACEYFKCTNADKFTTTATIREVFKHMYDNRVAVPTSVCWGGLRGHIICVVGFEATSEDDLLKWLNGETDTNPITKIIIDDPWGKIIEATNKYDGNQSGNDVEVSYNYFHKYWKDVQNSNRKYAHFIARPAAIV